MNLEIRNIEIESGAGMALKLGGLVNPEGRSRLLVLLPGMGYTNQGPLMHYLGQIGLHNGFDVLPVDYYFHKTQATFNSEQMPTLVGDCLQAIEKMLAQGKYETVVLAAKSLGTPIAAILAQSMTPAPAAIIMLTPIPESYQLVGDVPTLAVISTADPRYDPDSMVNTDTLTWMIYEGLNHSLESNADWVVSMETLFDIMQGCADFLAHYTDDAEDDNADD